MTEKITLAEAIERLKKATWLQEQLAYLVSEDIMKAVVLAVEAEEAQGKELAKRFEAQLPSAIFSKYPLSQWEDRVWAVYFKPSEWREIIATLDGSKAESEK